MLGRRVDDSGYNVGDSGGGGGGMRVLLTTYLLVCAFDKKNEKTQNELIEPIALLFSHSIGYEPNQMCVCACGADNVEREQK